jgi:hypothetical protein
MQRLYIGFRPAEIQYLVDEVGEPARSLLQPKII